MSIAQQIATSTPAPRTRPGLALVRILVLTAATAMGTAFVVGAVAIAIMVVASNLGG